MNKLEVVTSIADPASSGVLANGNLRLGPSTGSHVMDFGLGSGSNFGWIQMRSKSAYGTLFPFAINPVGGSVGIGTSAPVSTLTVGSTNGSVPGEITLNPTAASNEGGQIIFKRAINAGTNDWIIDQYGTTNANARLRLFNTSESNGINILENGFVGVGTAVPTVRLQVAGDIIANSIAGSSDARFKKNITPIENPLQKVLQLRGVNFDWKTNEFSARSFSENRSLGFIAQEVEKVLPEIVQTEKTVEGYKAVQYDKVVALLVEAIKEQQKQIDSLKLQVKKLQKKKK